MDYIHATCYTNIDGLKTEKWPEVFYFPPRVGDLVESKGGKSLRVVSVVHTMAGEHPTVRVELGSAGTQ